MTEHREAFIKTKRCFGITGKKLSEATGVSENHISEFINLKKDGSAYKRDVTTSVLDRLVAGMDEIEPGALQFYTDEVRGKKVNVTVANPTALVEAMDNDQISKLMFAIAAKMGNKASNKLENEPLIASC